MTRKFWTIAVAALFIICLSSVADAQRRAKTNRGLHAGHGQSENPGNQDENPGNGNQGETPQDPPAGTPDGETPAEEMTCDDLKNGTPGLYGLCIAFCEAHDCVPTMTDTGELDLSNCKKNDRKLLDKYRSKMKEGDPDMPCLPNDTGGGEPSTGGEVTCMCWTEDDFDKFRNPLVFYPDDASSLIETRQVQCEAYSDTEDGECWQYVDYKSYYQGFSTEDYREWPYGYWFELAVGDGACEDGPYCSRLEWCEGPDCTQSYGGYFSILLTDEEYAACKAELAELDPYCY